jgi:GNAT superfamily N-acetyltransferase
MGLTIRPFLRQDQAAARRLIVGAMREHFGFIDERFNHDLDDIATHYAGSYFLVASADGELIGTGCLVPQGDHLAQVVRMCVDSRQRRKGAGRAILQRLLEHAGSKGYRRVILETNDDWHDAIAFYQACGFTETVRASGGILFEIAV